MYILIICTELIYNIYIIYIYIYNIYNIHTYIHVIYIYIYIYFFFFQAVIQKFWEDGVLKELGTINARQCLFSMRSLLPTQMGSSVRCEFPGRIQGNLGVKPWKLQLFQRI